MVCNSENLEYISLMGDRQQQTKSHLKAVGSELNSGCVFMAVHLQGIIISYVIHITCNPVT